MAQTSKQRSKEIKESVAKKVAERNKKATEDLRSYIETLDKRRAEMGAGKNPQDYLTKKELAAGKTELTTKEKANQYNILRDTKQKELTDEVRKKREEQFAEEDAIRRPTKKELYDRQGKKYETGLQRYNKGRKFDEYGNLVEPDKDFIKGFFEGTPGNHINMPLYSDEQLDAMEEALDAYRNAYPGLLQELAKPSETGMSKQLQSMFGHMQNPILQGLMNPGSSQGSQVLFPSQIAQQSSGGGIDALLGQLAQQYAPQAANFGYDMASEYLPQVYGAATGFPGQMGGSIMNILSSLGNRFRPNQQQG